MSPASCSRFTIPLVCLALAATPAAAQTVNADGTPIQASPAPTVKTDHTARDAAVAAGVVAVGTALWLHHRQQAKKAAEAAAAASPPPPAPVESVAAAPPAPAPAPAPEPASAIVTEPPPLVTQAQPTPTPVHPAKPAVHRKPPPAPVAEPVAVVAVAPPPVVAQAPPVVTPAAPTPAPDSNRTLWMALGLVGALLLAAGTLPRMLMTPPSFRARVRMKPPSVAAPAFRPAEEAAA